MYDLQSNIELVILYSSSSFKVLLNFDLLRHLRHFRLPSKLGLHSSERGAASYKLKPKSFLNFASDLRPPTHSEALLRPSTFPPTVVFQYLTVYLTHFRSLYIFKMTTKTTTRTTLNSKRAQLPTTSTQGDPTPGRSNPRQAPPTNQNTNPPRPSLPPLTPSSEPRPDGHGGDGDGNGDGGGDDNDDDSNDPDPGDQGGQPPAPPSPPPAPTPVPAADEDHRRLIELLEAVRSKPKQKAKLREPDPFDGSDSRKLRSFLALCQ